MPWHKAVPVHLQSTEPQVLVTVLPHELPHVGSVQHVLPAPVQDLPLPQSVPHTFEPQLLVSVTPHCPLHTGNAQQVLVVVSHDLPLPQEVVEHVREPQLFVKVTLHCPLHAGRSQHTPAAAPVAFLQVWPLQLHGIVPPQPSSKLPH